MTFARAVLGGALVLAIAAPACAQSLWHDDARVASLYADTRARAAGDIVTIIIAESSSSTRSAETQTEKDTSRTASINELPGVALAGRNSAWAQYFKYDIGGKASHDGKGSITRSDAVTGQISARVVKVLGNGDLVLEGRRAVLVNDETQVITISGTVRPADITAANTVLSSQIADAEIQLVGRGLIADTQRPGILYRILDWLRLF